MDALHTFPTKLGYMFIWHQTYSARVHITETSCLTWVHQSVMTLGDMWRCKEALMVQCLLDFSCSKTICCTFRPMWGFGEKILAEIWFSWLELNIAEIKLLPKILCSTAEIKSSPKLCVFTVHTNINQSSPKISNAHIKLIKLKKCFKTFILALRGA